MSIPGLAQSYNLLCRFEVVDSRKVTLDSIYLND